MAHKSFGESFEPALRLHWPMHANDRTPDRRLKIGYVSGDFREHAVAYFIEPVFANHDKSHFEIFCYSNSSKHDAFTDRLIAESDHWRPCLSMSDDELAKRIQADGIDILVDLAGHTAYNRLLVFARKPAPIQITYLGYPGTSGLSAMDYRLTDNYTEPQDGAGADQYYTETLLRLPDSMWCYRPAEDMEEITPLPALINGLPDIRFLQQRQQGWRRMPPAMGCATAQPSHFALRDGHGAGGRNARTPNAAIRPIGCCRGAFVILRKIAYARIPAQIAASGYLT